MSLESIAEFAGKMGSDAQIAKQAEAATAGIGNNQERAVAITKLGVDLGFDFSTEEALATFAALRRESGEDVELSEEELGAVAGGASAAERRLQQLLFQPTGSDVRAGVGHYANYMKFLFG